MGSMSIWHWFVVILWLIVIGFPVGRILHRVGFSRWWVIVAFVPFINVIALWIFAYVRWPLLSRASN